MIIEMALDIASSIGLLGLVGSLYVANWKYERKRNDKREALKRSIFTELLSTNHLDRAYVTVVDDSVKDYEIELEPDQESGIPVNEFLSVKIGPSFSNELGLLNDNELEAVVAFYAEVETLNNIIRTRRIYELSMKQGHDSVKRQMDCTVVGEIMDVKDKRDEVLRMWCSELGYSREKLAEEYDIYINTNM